jgi:hypothetical protein
MMGESMKLLLWVGPPFKFRAIFQSTQPVIQWLTSYEKNNDPRSLYLWQYLDDICSVSFPALPRPQIHILLSRFVTC